MWISEHVFKGNWTESPNFMIYYTLNGQHTWGPLYLVKKSTQMHLHSHSHNSMRRDLISKLLLFSLMFHYKADVPSMDIFIFAPSPCRIWKTQLVYEDFLSHLPHNFWSSYEYLIHYQSGDSRAHWVVAKITWITLTIQPTMLSIFWALFF